MKKAQLTLTAIVTEKNKAVNNRNKNNN